MIHKIIYDNGTTEWYDHWGLTKRTDHWGFDITPVVEKLTVAERFEEARKKSKKLEKIYDI